MKLWEDLKARGWKAIQEMCDSRMVEGQQLEFKRKRTPDGSGLSDDDKRGLGETLSGMSNAVGGILIFGIEDEKDADGIDCAQQAQKLPNVRALSAKIGGLIVNYLTPPNPDIEALPVESANGNGVVAIRIGQSEMRPHMSLAPGHQRYYLRVHATNQPMLDFQVRDMMRIKTSPRLTLGYQLRPGAVSVSAHESKFVLTLVNEGTTSAYQPYVIVMPQTNIHAIGVASAQFESIQLAVPEQRGFQGAGRLAIHPGQEVAVVNFVAHVKRINDVAHLRIDANSNEFVRWDACHPIEVNVNIGCEDSPVREIKFTVPQAELEEMADSIVLARKTFFGERRF